ncbi:hypothetical protein J4E83_009202 [Alternaria metachromatica]|uniref:uncharacterized protein n=1 Tax=Alternaria metachromatica TaxID=283354 RepID=UPI0020C3F6AF|nr:uncharacterized protein J4E83_009202 [Alternaria metachromatica]KAI4608397.1 hypothetical protein J4E83_009202 [Alternaria metachromatica]
MKLSLLIMAAVSTLVLAGGGKKEESVLCKKCDIYSLEHCEKDVCKDKLNDRKQKDFEWYMCVNDCNRQDICKYVPAGETVACGDECTPHAICTTT